MTTAFLIFLLSISTLVVAEEPTPIEAVIQGNELFAKNVYKIFSKGSGNVFFSPFSIHALLSMVSQGSTKETLKAFTRVLNISGTNVAADGYQEIMKLLNSVEKMTLLIANKVFVKENYELFDPFKAVVTDKFLSEVESVDFDHAEPAVKIINTWVENKTNNKIKNLVNPDDLNSKPRLVLVNAIYFRSSLQFDHRFDPKSTEIEKFYIDDQQTIRVKMMHNKITARFTSDAYLDADVLELRYRNWNMTMVIVLPNKRNGIKELEQKLATANLADLIEAMDYHQLNIAIPKFKAESKMDLKKPLSELGLKIIFDKKKADFSKMLKTSEVIYVTQAIQKAGIEVDEHGSEAAPATKMLIPRPDCDFPPPRPKPKSFRADHPFMVFLVKSVEHKKLVLFQGRILQPTTVHC